MTVIFVSTVISSSPLSMNYNPTKFLCISNNKSNSSGGGGGRGRFRGFFPGTAKYIGVTHSRKENLD